MAVRMQHGEVCFLCDLVRMGMPLLVLIVLSLQFAEYVLLSAMQSIKEIKREF